MFTSSDVGIRGARRAVVAVSLGFVSALASASSVTYDVTIVSAQSSITSDTLLSVPLAGSFIGDFDATTNPTGTKTTASFFSNTNVPFNYTATFVGDGSFTTNPTGGFTMTINTETLTFTLGGLSIDFLAGNAAGVDATLNLSYPTFYTKQPTAFFPSVGTIPLPLGGATFVELSASQSGGSVAGLIVPSGKTTYTFATAVPVDLLATIEANGQEFGGTPVPFVLPIAGTIDFGGENVVITLSGSNTFELTQPIDPPATFENQPIGLPTVLPPGSTANLLFSGSIAALTVSQGLDIAITADAAAQLPSGDLNGDGSVGPADLAILLGAWGTSGPGDLNNDGTVGPADLALLLGSWT